MATKRTPVPAEFQSTMTEPQEKFIRSLLEERDTSNPYPDDPDGRSSGEVLKAQLDDPEHPISKDQASKIIAWLKNREIRKDMDEKLKLPDGFYAVKMEKHKNDLTFYRLQTGKGRWAGYQFLSLQAGPNLHPVRREERAKVLAEIRHQGVDECRRLYGREIGRCGVCGLPLTDDTSRAIGIGPICLGRM